MQTEQYLIKNTQYFKRSMINTTLKINSFIITLIFLFFLVPLRAERNILHADPDAGLKAGLMAGDIPQAVIDAFRTGNTAVLSGYFSTSIELAILDQEDIYSKQQAELIIKEFFSKHVPSSFVILHKGGKEGSQYAIGNLTTSSGNFRVTLLIKQKENKPYIHQLRFEEGNAE
jgi:hypothetical protein